ncbi:MAG: PAS domain S-box protein, partial [Cyanophyceae cyanobacterium]
MGSLGDQPFRVILAAALDAMVVSDAQGRLLEVNAAASELLGSPMEALVGQTWGSLVSSPQQLSGLLGVLVAGESGRGELELTGEGVSKIVEYSLSSTSEGSQSLLILRDATERIQREKGLLADQQMFQTLFEILPVGVAITDATGNLIKVNPASERILGLSISEQLDRTYDAPDWQIIYPDGRPMPAEDFASVKALQQQRPIFGEEQGILHPNGDIAWIEVNAAPIPLKGYGVVITYIDRTERKAAELELQNSELRMRQILEAIDVMFFIKSADNHRALYVSPAYEKIWGRTCESFYQDPSSWIEGIHPDDRDALMKIVDQDLSLTSPTDSKEYRIVRPDGSYIWVADSIAPILGKTGKVEYITGIVMDITARKEAQLVLMQQAEREHLLRTLTQNIRQSLDIDQILAGAVEGVRHLLGADRVVICRLEQDRSGDMITESVGMGWPVVQGSHVQNPCFKEIWGQQHCPETFISIDNIQQFKMSGSDQKLLKSLHIRALLDVPIVKDDAVWGLLCVHHCGTYHTWQDWEIHLLQNVADQLAIAIHQSDLFRQSQIWAANLEGQVKEHTADLQEALAFESTLRYITEQVRSSLDEAEILQAVVESLGQGLKADGCYVSHYHEDRLHYTVDYEWTSVHLSIKGRTYTTNLDRKEQLYRDQGIQHCFNHLDAGWVTAAS